ncbi:MAG: DNA repair protein RecN [Cyanobacteria bacterium SIG31]|nr:DNA repair protein RecN [Cyanobacteria bacterium SIG31]
MLNKILIKNYILIDELELDFTSGLNIITGETGAGKSILINAIDIAFGAKVGKEVIKSDAEKAIIEITLSNKKQDITKLFDEYAIDNYGNEIILSREITQSGSRSRINGCLVNQEFIKIFRELFLDIHSQHQTYSFLQPKYHIALLDAYIKNQDLELFYQGFEKYKNMLAELEQLKNASQKTEEQIDFLKFQVNEIETAELTSTTEDEELNNELSILENVEKLKELTGSSYWSLSGDDGCVLDALMQIKNNLAKASGMDNNLSDTESEMLNAIEILKEVSASLRNYSSSLENDTERINAIQERLFVIEKLKRKYGGSIEKILETGEKLRKELDNIEFSTQKIENLSTEIENTRIKLLSQAEQISNKRKDSAKELSQKIIEKLEKLELPKVKFEISFEQCDLCQNGIDKVEFLISTNISEGLKPLAKVASGGEISRVMLAIKTIFAQADNIDTIIFDEIDTGISGKTSQSVAEEVKLLSNFMQIIMITHQAIIASKADRHFYVKKTQDEKTMVSINILNEDSRKQAIAELASGIVSEDSLKFADLLISG